MEKQLTTKDIEKAQILLTTNDGRYLLGVSDDEILIKMIVGFCKFVVADPETIEQIPITQLIIGEEK